MYVFRLFQIRHRFGCYDQVTEVNRLRVRYCNWVRFLKITQQHHSEQHVNVLGTKIKGIYTHQQPVRYAFLFHRNTFLLLFIFIHDDYAIIFGYLAEPVRDLTPCVDLWSDPVCRVCENRDETVRFITFVFLLILSFFRFGFNRRTHVRSDQKHTCQHWVDRALPAGAAGRNIFHASRTLFKKHVVQTHDGHNSGR